MTRMLLVVLGLSILSAVACKDGTKSRPVESAELNASFDLENEVPLVADRFQIVGLDAEGRVIYGPIDLPKAAMVTLTGVPVAVVTVQVTFLIGTTPIGMVSAPVDLSSGSAQLDFTKMMATEIERLDALTIVPAAAEIAVQGVQDFQVSGHFSDGSTYGLTGLAQWSSSNAAVATIDEAGRATGLSAGTSTITATVADVLSAEALLTVTSAVDPVLLPSVSSVTPDRGPNTGGTSITLAGTNLLEATAVSFGGAAALAFQADSDTQITATTPATSSGRVHVQVSTPSGASMLTSSDQFTFYSLPVVQSISPQRGPQAGGDEVVITGSAFTEATGVSFGGSAASSFSIDSDTQITAVAPPGAGIVDTRVTTANGGSPLSSASRYAYVPTPTLATLTPGNGPVAGGNPVVLTGTQFDQDATISFGASPASFVLSSSTQATATAPAGSGTVRVTIRTAGGTSEALDYAYLAIPALTSLTPSSGPEAAGNQVQLVGSSFTAATGVSFGEAAASSFTVVSDTEVVAVAPAGTGVVRVSVLTPGGNSNSLDYRYAVRPVLSALAPSGGPEAGGNPVTITGAGLTQATAVQFGEAAASSFTVVSDTELTAIAAPGSGSVQVTVTTGGGQSSALVYQYSAVPALFNLVPDVGPQAGGTFVALLGAGLSTATGVSFGELPAASFVVFSESQINAVAPAGTGTVEVTVQTPGGTSNTLPFAYRAVPILAPLSPDRGPLAGGNPVALTGTGFIGATNVSFGSAPAAAFIIRSDTLIDVIAPAGEGAVDVNVRTPGGVSNAQSYTYVPGPSLVDLVPASGPEEGGNTVVLSGGDFTGASAVQFGETAAPSFTVTSMGEIRAVAPAGTGTVDVTVTTADGTSNVLRYTFVPLPEVYAIAPESGPAVGGTAVTITGAYLTGATVVRFGDIPATSFSVTSDTEIVAVASPGTDVVEVIVTTAGGTSDAVLYSYRSAAVLAGVMPARGPNVGGNSVTLLGSELGSAVSVQFGEASASFVIVSETELTAVAPAGSGSVLVTVTTADGLSNAFPYAYVSPAFLTSLSPSSGPAAGETLVTITGGGFEDVSAVMFGTVPATVFTVSSATEITAVAPAGVGAVSVRVTTAGGPSDALSYTYLAPLIITSLDPVSGPEAGGNAVTLSGTGFTDVTTVAFGATAASSFTVVSDTQLVATAPAGTGLVSVTVTTPGGSASGASYAYVAAPVIASLAPAGGPVAGGGTVSIVGVGFTATAGVSFGGSAAAFSVVSDGEISATVPPGAGAVDVTVSTAFGSDTAVAAYTYVSAPVLSALAPSGGPVSGGTLVNLSGAGLDGALSVTFGGVTASIVSASADELAVIAPEAAEGAQVMVLVTTTGGVSNALAYDYVAVPGIVSVTPDQGPETGGNTVTIAGLGFSTADGVAFGGLPASAFTVLSDTQITATVPAGSGPVDVTVVTLGGTAMTGGAYTYLSAPAITGLTPSAGPFAGGNSVSIAGSGLATTTQVSFGTSPVSFSVTSDTEIVAVAPSGAGLVDVTVMTSVGTATASAAYGYVSTPVLTAITPSGGPLSGGASAVLAGAGLDAVTMVTFDGIPATLVSASVNELLVTTPSGVTEGEVAVVASGIGGVSNALAYTYAAPPEATSVSPGQGPEAGGNTVTIEGAGFSSAQEVYFANELVSSFTIVDDGELSVVVPAGVGTVAVTVFTLGGSATLASAYAYAPVPIVSSLSPAQGPEAGGTTVTITGTDLVGASAVSFGAAAVTFTELSPTQIVAQAPAGTGTVSVTVTTPGGTSAGTSYTYSSIPTLSAVTPSSGPEVGGNTVTITGSGFSGASLVAFGATPAPAFTVSSDSEIAATVPAGTGSAGITVTTPGGIASGVSYVYRAPPTISSLTPAAGPLAGGNTVVLTGSGFTSASGVLFGSSAVTFTVDSDTQLSAVAPAGSGTVDIMVTTPGGAATAIAAYSYVSTPVLAVLVPSSGPLGGDSISILGAGLAGTFEVTIGGVPAVITSNTPTMLTVNTPASGAGAVSVVAVTAGGSSNALTYTYVPPPTIDDVDPSAGPEVGGNTLTIAGFDLSTAVSVSFGGTSVTPTVISDDTLSVVVPAGTGLVDISVTTAGGSDTLVAAYDYAPTPSISSTSPAQGPQSGGTSVSIVGAGLSYAESVSFGGNPASFTVVSPTEITAITPAGTGVVDLVVTSPGGSATAVAAFSYVSPPTLAGVSPGSGPTAGGNAVTITGSGLSTATAVSFGGNTATPTVISPTELSVFVPAGAGAGSVAVAITTLGGTSNTGSYTYVDAPVIFSLSPTFGAATGGTAVTISGAALASTLDVTFDGVPASYTVNSDTQITATAPAGSGAVDVSVTTLGGSATAVGAFEYVSAPGLGPISPNAGPLSGGAEVTLTGILLANASAVTFDGLAATIVSNTATQITVLTPAHSAGTAEVIVTTPGGDSNAGSYTYLPPPTLDDLFPNVGPEAGGNTITILGTDFSTAFAVFFDAVEATPTIVSDEELSVVVPAGFGVVDVTVSAAGGYDIVSNGYTYVSDPSVASLSSFAGPTAGGNIVTINGSDLDYTTSVTFGGALASFTVISNTEINVVVPAGSAGSVDVVVTTIAGSATIIDAYTYIAAPAIVASPTAGPVAGGTSVTISGINLQFVTTVSFGTESTSFTMVSPTQLIATAPASATAEAVALTVTSAGGTSNAVSYSYLDPPLISSLTPSQGPNAGGTLVTIEGVNLETTATVQFGAFSGLAPELATATQVVQSSPAGSGTVDVSVTTAGGTSNTLPYTFLVGPSIDSISPNAGEGATGVDIIGSGLSAATSVRFGANEADFVVFSDSLMSVSAPANVDGYVDVTITTPGGSTTIVEGFLYVAGP